jgi:hypothetical protein
MSDQQTAESTVARLERKLESLQKEALLPSVRDEVAETDRRIAGLPAALAKLRSRGYQFHNYLEARAEAVAERWPDQRDQAQRDVRRAEAELRGEVDGVAQAVANLQRVRSRPLSSAKAVLDRVDKELDGVQSTVKARTDALKTGYRASRDEARTLEKEVKECHDLLDLVDAASFRLLPDEAPIAQVQATWLEDGEKRGPQGRLYITDCRLLFERHEEVATKKVLFVTTRKETVRELMWEVAVTAIASADTAKQRRGLVMRQDLLRLGFDSPAPLREAVLQLKGDAVKWDALIGRVTSGEVDNERVGAVAAAAAAEAEGEGGVAAPRPMAATYRVPSKCPHCAGGMDSAGLIRGVAALPCDYCGVMVTLERAT